MPLHEILFLACLFTSTGCLALGFAQAGRWSLVPAVILPAVLLWLARKLAVPWLPSVSLLLFVLLAAAGLVTGASPLGMILASTLALAGWDLAFFSHTVEADQSSGAQLLERRHLRALALALVPGLLVAVLGRLVSLPASFALLVLLAALLLFSLDRVLVYLKNNHP